MTAQNLPQKTTPHISTHIRREVAAGFRTSAEIVQSVLDVFCDDAEPDALRPLAERLTQEAVTSQLKAQASWPEVTDCDRLDEALAELNQNGIVCRQDFSCCGNCGVAEIGDEMEAECRAGLRVRGYAFYHMQDTEAATEGHGLYLNYGAVEEGDAAALTIGHEITETLERHGLRTHWNGRWDTRIGVELDWKRRRPHEVSG